MSQISKLCFIETIHEHLKPPSNYFINTSISNDCEDGELLCPPPSNFKLNGVNPPPSKGITSFSTAATAFGGGGGDGGGEMGGEGGGEFEGWDMLTETSERSELLSETDLGVGAGWTGYWRYKRGG
jgi:hypothetical protein